MKIQIEESALETMKIMVQRLQDERDMLLVLLNEIHSDVSQGAIPNDDDSWWEKTAAAIAACTESK